MNDNENPELDLPELVTDLFDRMIFMETMMRLVAFELVTTRTSFRIALEDMLWQATTKRQASAKGGLTRGDLLAQYRRIEEFAAEVNTLLARPLVARAAPVRD